jgi:hypothetical protein
MDRSCAGIDLRRRRSVIYAMNGDGEKLFCERIDNGAQRLLEVVSAAGEGAEASRLRGKSMPPRSMSSVSRSNGSAPVPTASARRAVERIRWNGFSSFPEADRCIECRPRSSNIAGRSEP